VPAATEEGIIQAETGPKLNFKRCASDANLYVCREGGKIVIICLYVDDLIIIGNHEELIKWTRKELSIEFEMTDLGLIHYCLRIEVWQEPGKIFISQQKYAKEILKAFGMTKCKEMATPMEVNASLFMEDSSNLIYLCNTRPDINFAIGVLSRFSNQPRENHWWKAGMRVLKYLKGTIDYGIIIQYRHLSSRAL